jgi:PPOX class probable F420-dependent enzyme
MLDSKPGVIDALDQALVGFLTAVDSSGQPQTSPVWFLRDDDDLIVYNRPTSPRLASIGGNERVAFTLRADREGSGMLSLEGRARVDPSLPPAHLSEPYVAKYADGIEGLGWGNEEFAGLYSVGIRITVDRVRVFGIEHVLEADRPA